MRNSVRTIENDNDNKTETKCLVPTVITVTKHGKNEMEAEAIQKMCLGWTASSKAVMTPTPKTLPSQDDDFRREKWFREK